MFKKFHLKKMGACIVLNHFQSFKAKPRVLRRCIRFLFIFIYRICQHIMSHSQNESLPS